MWIKFNFIFWKNVNILSDTHMYMHNKNAMCINWISEKKLGLLFLFFYSVHATHRMFKEDSYALFNHYSASHRVYEHLHAAGIIKQQRTCPAIIQSHYSHIIQQTLKVSRMLFSWSSCKLLCYFTLPIMPISAVTFL